MLSEKINQEIKLKNIDDNIQTMNLKNYYEINKNNIETNKELKIIETKLKIDKSNNEFDYQKELFAQKSFEQDVLLKQSEEKLEMESKFQTMLSKLFLDKINEYKNN